MIMKAVCPKSTTLFNRFGLALLLGGITLSATSLSGQILHVNASSPACPGGDGASWATAFCSLQAALDAAPEGSQIWVAQGTYLPEKDADGNIPASGRLKTFFIQKNIQLYGGFIGNETTLSQRDWALNPTILSGDVGLPDIHTDNAYHVVWINNVSPFARLDGFIIEKGWANGPGGNNHDLGAGLYINGDNSVESSPTIANCIFRDHHSNFSSGAAVYVCARWSGVARPVFLQCLFLQNPGFSKSQLRHYARDHGVCEPVYRHCTISRSAAPSGFFEATNHLEFLAPAPTRVQMSIYNSIIWNNGLATHATGLSMGIRRVDLFNCLTDSLGSSTHANNSLLYQDPRFVAAQAADYQLQENSPAIDAGNNAYLDTLSKDLAVQDRLVGGLVDLGAFEFQSTCLNSPEIVIAMSFADCLGQAVATVSGGAAPYVYLWSNGHDGPAAVGLTAGQYSVTATDANGCTAVAEVMIEELAPLAIDAIAVVPEGCSGTVAGSAAVSVSGGTPPYAFAWSDGQNTAEASGLPPGVYAVSVVDANGCATMGEAAITAAPPLESQLAVLQEPVCHSSQDGRAEAVALGGTPPYAYGWSNGETSAAAVNLSPGLHYVSITDATGCVAIDSIVLSFGYQMLIGIAQTQVLRCHGDSNAAVQANPIGGQAPYQFLWDNGATTAELAGLSAGSYFVTITDANGCTASGGAMLQNPPALAVELDALPPTCPGDADGEIAVWAAGGTPPYDYQWSDGQAGATALGLEAGAYAVTVSDSQGCTASASISIMTDEPFDLSLTLDQENTLWAAEPGLSYQWIACATGEPIPGATQQSFTPAESGSYAVILSNGECQEATECLEVMLVSASQLQPALRQAAVFPNPNPGRFTLDLPWAAEATLYDATGRAVLRQRYAAGQQSVQANLPVGTYLLELRHEKGRETHRLLMLAH